MLKLFRQIIPTGIIKWVRPLKLVEAIYNSCRVVAEKFRGTDGITNTKYDKSCIRPMYGVISIPVSNVHKSSLVAGLGSVNTSTVAGSGDKFFVTGLPKGLVAVGKSPDSDMGVLYKDFNAHGNGYIFNRSPEYFGVVDTRTGDPSIHFCCVGGEPQVKDQPQFKSIYNSTSSDLVINTVDIMTDDALCLAGVSNAPVNAAAGVSTIVGNATVGKSQWREGDTKYIEAGGRIYSCPHVFNVRISSNDLAVKNGSPITTDHINSTLVFPICGSWYWVDGNRIDCDSLPTSLYEEYPELVNGLSIREQLATLLANRGIVTIDTTHSKNVDIKTISKYIPLANSMHFIKHIDIDLSNSKVTTLTRNSVDTLYILYSNSGVSRVRPQQSCNSLLRSVSSDNGSIRITSCINTGSVLYAISTNSTCCGARVTQNSKIYGIVAAIGGKTPSEDVVYSYKNINNESLGAGLEVIVTALI